MTEKRRKLNASRHMPANENPQTTLAAADRCNFLVDSAVDGSATKIRLLAKATRSAAVLNMAPGIVRAPYAATDSTLRSHDLMCSRCDCLLMLVCLDRHSEFSNHFDLTMSLTFCPSQQQQQSTCRSRQPRCRHAQAHVPTISADENCGRSLLVASEAYATAHT